MHIPSEAAVEETEEQIEARLNERFSILEALVDASIDGTARALFVSGPPGLGKSFTVEKKLENWDPDEMQHTKVKGYVRATGLFRMLYKNRHPGNTLVFDDADTIFFDETSLNLLKAVCDSNDRRVVSYLSEAVFIDSDEATPIPNKFEFEGTIIFITNLDFDAMILKGHKLAPHLQALISRAHYVDLSMRTTNDYIVRIKQVVRGGMLRDQGLTEEMEDDVMQFIDDHLESLRELSLRMAMKIGALRKQNRPNWKAVASITCCRNIA